MTDFPSLTLGQLTGLLQTGELTAEQALDAHLARIGEVNGEVNAVVTLDEEGARERARQADVRLRAAAAGSAPPAPELCGVPMTHKDSIATKGIRTTLGSPLFADSVPERSALIIDRLQAAGVVSSGKSNVPEFAAGSHTFNPLFGTTLNPYDTSRSAGGSSGGAAAAIAAGIQPAGDGSDTGGSLRTPGSFCNLVGYRPDQGRIPLWPAANPWAWVSRQGFLGRRVEDVRMLMRAVTGPHPQSPHPTPEDGAYAQRRRRDLTGLRVGWTADFGLGVPVEAEVLRVLEPQLEVLAALGAEVVEATPDLRDADEVFLTTRAYDFAASYGELVRTRGDEIKATMRENVEHGLRLTVDDLFSAGAARARLRRATTAFFSECDLLVTPAVQVLPFAAELEFPTSVAGTATPHYLDWMRAATLISATGLPCLSVPGGFSSTGLPVGLQMVAPEFRDGLLLDAAECFEDATGHWQRRPDLG
ncbi:amidase family protein [Brevibacterium sp.]|uniref:amidase n=1 Tax=Brevibacterium sp. TaxID=1701 RepID=UPI0025BE7BC6|nr:amidase family protein [Brevibacterium sp.]